MRSICPQSRAFAVSAAFEPQKAARKTKKWLQVLPASFPLAGSIHTAHGLHELVKGSWRIDDTPKPHFWPCSKDAQPSHAWSISALWANPSQNTTKKFCINTSKILPKADTRSKLDTERTSLSVTISLGGNQEQLQGRTTQQRVKTKTLLWSGFLQALPVHSLHFHLSWRDYEELWPRLCGSWCAELF